MITRLQKKILIGVTGSITNSATRDRYKTDLVIEIPTADLLKLFRVTQFSRSTVDDLIQELEEEK